MNLQEAIAAWRADQAHLAERGVHLPDVIGYIPDGFRHNYRLAMDSADEIRMAMDAQPTLTTAPNSAVPFQLTNFIDPKVFKILFSPNKAAMILPKVKKGSWLDDTALFPVIEHTGEVSSYGDFSENGHAGANTNWPQRQAYLFQTIKEYGERELERAGLARINWISELDIAAATVMDKFLNLTYFFGVKGLNVGLLNDPNLGPSLTPAPKAAGGVQWIKNGAIVATANEIYADIQALFNQLVVQTAGLTDQNTQVVLAMSPSSAVALTATNTFNVNVTDMLKKNFPNIRVETAVQYGQKSAPNPQGVAAGNLVQLIAESIEGQDTGYCAFNEKMRSHPIIKALSSFKQKLTGGTWGAIIRMPVAFVSMLGV
jgi:hypothetical protein